MSYIYRERERGRERERHAHKVIWWFVIFYIMSQLLLDDDIMKNFNRNWTFHDYDLVLGYNWFVGFYHWPRIILKNKSLMD
jgi:hypothetical protein